MDTDDAENRKSASELVLGLLTSMQGAGSDTSGSTGNVNDAPSTLRHCSMNSALSASRLRALELLLRSASSWPGELACRALSSLAAISQDGPCRPCRFEYLPVVLAALGRTNISAAGVHDAADSISVLWHASVLSRLQTVLAGNEDSDENLGDDSTDSHVADLIRCVGALLIVPGGGLALDAEALGLITSPLRCEKELAWEPAAASCAALSDIALRRGFPAVNVSMVAGPMGEPLVPCLLRVLGHWQHSQRGDTTGDATAARDAAGLTLVEALGRLLIQWCLGTSADGTTGSLLFMEDGQALEVGIITVKEMKLLNIKKQTLICLLGSCC